MRVWLYILHCLQVLQFGRAHRHHHHHLFLNREGRWGTTDDFTTSFLHFCLELQAYPFPDVVFPPPLLSALSSSPFLCALQDGFGQTWWTGDMSIPMQFVSLSDLQVFVWLDCLLDLCMDLLVTGSLYETHGVLQCLSSHLENWKTVISPLVFHLSWVKFCTCSCFVLASRKDLYSPWHCLKILEFLKPFFMAMKVITNL